MGKLDSLSIPIDVCMERDQVDFSRARAHLKGARKREIDRQLIRRPCNVLRVKYREKNKRNEEPGYEMNSLHTCPPIICCAYPNPTNNYTKPERVYSYIEKEIKKCVICLTLVLYNCRVRRLLLLAQFIFLPPAFNKCTPLC
jgi:hypothetical protein